MNGAILGRHGSSVVNERETAVTPILVPPAFDLDSGCSVQRAIFRCDATDFVVGQHSVDDRFHLDFIWTPEESRRKGHASKLMDYIMNKFNLSSFPFSEESIGLFRKFNWTFIENPGNLPFVVFNKRNRIKIEEITKK